MKRFYKKCFCLLLLVICGIIGWYSLPLNSAYRLDYNKVVINLPVVARYAMRQVSIPYGEIYLGKDLANEFIHQGYDVKLYSVEDSFSNLNFNEGINIYLRHMPELSLSSYHQSFDKDKVSVLFETIPYTLEQAKNADIVFTGSFKRQKYYQSNGVNAYFLPQFTRTDKFYPAFDNQYKTRVLFVGNQWPEMPPRKSVAFAIDMGIELDVYGADWEQTLKGKYKHWWKGRQLKGDVLKYYYSSADIVLNDVRPEMIALGVISNRVFDVTACKGFLISEYMPEIAEVYGDAIPMYKTKEEFKALIEYYLAHPLERQAKAERAYQITLEYFTAEKSVKKMMGIIHAYIWRHNLGK